MARGEGVTEAEVEVEVDGVAEVEAGHGVRESHSCWQFNYQHLLLDKKSKTISTRQRSYKHKKQGMYNSFWTCG